MKNQSNIIKQKTTHWEQKQNTKTKKREENTSKQVTQKKTVTVS